MREELFKRKTKRKYSRTVNPQRQREFHYSLTLTEMFERFIAYKKTEGLTRQTISDYYTHFRYLCEFIGHDISRDEMTVELFRDYIGYMLHERGLSPVTANVRIRTTRAFLRFCYQENISTLRFMSVLSRLRRKKIRFNR